MGLLVYLGASFSTLEAVDLFQQRYPLPDWLFTAVLIPLSIGLVVVLVIVVVQMVLGRRSVSAGIAKNEERQEANQHLSESVTAHIAQLEAAAQAENWEAIVDLYRGPFLEQFYVPGSPNFESWRGRTGARRLTHRAFAHVVAQRESAGDHSGALDVAGRWTELEPLDEEAQHALIALLAQSGNRAAALEQFKSYRERLRRELEVDPLDETLELVERIRAGEAPAFQPRPETAAGLGEAEPDDPDVKLLKESWPVRRTLNVLLVYIASAWLAIEVADRLIENASVPEWVFSVLLSFLVVGLAFALILAWWPPSEQRPGASRWASISGALFSRRAVYAGLLALVSLWLAVQYIASRAKMLEAPPMVLAPGAVDSIPPTPWPDASVDWSFMPAVLPGLLLLIGVAGLSLAFIIITPLAKQRFHHG